VNFHLFIRTKSTLGRTMTDEPNRDDDYEERVQQPEEAANEHPAIALFRSNAVSIVRRHDVIHIYCDLASEAKVIWSYLRSLIEGQQ